MSCHELPLWGQVPNGTNSTETNFFGPFAPKKKFIIQNRNKFPNTDKVSDRENVSGAKSGHFLFIFKMDLWWLQIAQLRDKRRLYCLKKLGLCELYLGMAEG